MAKYSHASVVISISLKRRLEGRLSLSGRCRVAIVKKCSRERMVSRELGPFPRRRRPEWCGIYRAKAGPSLLNGANDLKFRGFSDLAAGMAWKPVSATKQCAPQFLWA